MFDYSKSVICIWMATKYIKRKNPKKTYKNINIISIRMHDSLKKIHKLMLKIVKINSQTHMNHTKAPQAMEDVRYKRRSGSP